MMLDSCDANQFFYNSELNSKISRQGYYPIIIFLVGRPKYYYH